MNNVDKAIELAIDFAAAAECGATSFDAKQALRTHLEAMEADRVMLLDALKELVKNRDENHYKKEEFFSGEYGEYWSPHASMVNSEQVSKARSAIAQSEAQS